MKKYSIQDLTVILGVSRTAVNRKVEKYRFNTVQEYVNGRPLKLVSLSDDDIESLKKEICIYKPDDTVRHSPDDTLVYEVTSNNTVKSEANSNYVIESILAHNKTVLEQVRYYADTLIESERSKVRLIEDSERVKQQEYYETKATNTQLTERVKALEEQINELKKENESLKNKKWWKK